MYVSEFLYQDFLQGIHALVGDSHPVDLADLIADMQRCLSVDHTAMHDPRHDAASIFRHLQSDSLLERNRQTRTKED